MIQSILEQIRDFVAGSLAGALAPFAGVVDFFTSPLPLALLIVAAIVAACGLAGWFFGATVRWCLGWVVTAAIAFASGAVWLWLALRTQQRRRKARP